MVSAGLAKITLLSGEIYLFLVNASVYGNFQLKPIDLNLDISMYIRILSIFTVIL